MNKYRYLFLVLITLFLSVKCYATEINNEFIYGKWEIDNKIDPKECSKYFNDSITTLTQLSSVKITCNITGKINFDKNQHASLNGNVNIGLTKGDFPIYSDALKYLFTLKWGLISGQNKMNLSVIDSDLRLESSMNNKIEIPNKTNIKQTVKITIIDDSTFKLVDENNKVGVVFKRILN